MLHYGLTWKGKIKVRYASLCRENPVYSQSNVVQKDLQHLMIHIGLVPSVFLAFLQHDGCIHVFHFEFVEKLIRLPA